MKRYNEAYKNSDLTGWVDLSTYCNAGCPQCHRTSSNGDKVDWLPLIQWDIETFKKAFPLKEISRYSELHICGTWGDPVMNKDIFEILSYIIKNSKAVVRINTNGSIRDEDFWWDLGCLSHGTDSYKVSGRLHVVFDVDGINQEMHELYRQKTSLEKIKQNIESYCSTGATAHAMTIVFKHNQDYLEDIEKMVRSWGVTGDVLSVESNRFNDENKQTFANGIVLEQVNGSRV